MEYDFIHIYLQCIVYFFEMGYFPHYNIKFKYVMDSIDGNFWITNQEELYILYYF